MVPEVHEVHRPKTRGRERRWGRRLGLGLHVAWPVLLVTECLLQTFDRGSAVLFGPVVLGLIVLGPVLAGALLLLPAAIWVELRAGRVRVGLVLVALGAAVIALLLSGETVSGFAMEGLPELLTEGAALPLLLPVLGVTVAGLALAAAPLPGDGVLARAVGGGLLLGLLDLPADLFLRGLPPVTTHLEARLDPVLDALDRHVEDHGSAPESLDALVPDYLGELPPEVAGSWTGLGPGAVSYWTKEASPHYWLELRVGVPWPGWPRYVHFDSQGGGWFSYD